MSPGGIPAIDDALRGIHDQQRTFASGERA